MIDLSNTDTEHTIMDGLSRLLERSDTVGWTIGPHGCALDLGFWRPLTELVPIGLGGFSVEDGLSFLSLSHCAEQLGVTLKGLALIDHSVALRFLDRCGDRRSGGIASSILDRLEAGGEPVALIIDNAGASSMPRAVVTSGALAKRFLWIDCGGSARFCELDAPLSFEPNMADLPVGLMALDAPKWELLEGVDGDSVGLARCEHKVLMASVFAGMLRAALDLAVDYAKTRVQFGAPIGSFQAIAHGLAEAKVAADSAQILSAEAAWSRDAEPARFTELAQMAYAYAARAGADAVQTCTHVFGGYGLTPDYPVQRYFRTLRALTLAVGDPKRDLRELGARLVRRAPDLPFQLRTTQRVTEGSLN